MKTKSKNLEIPQIVRQVLFAYLEKKVFHYEEFDNYYEDTKEIFSFLNHNRADAMDFWQEVCDGTK